MNPSTTYFDIMACVARLSRSKPPSEAAMVSVNLQELPPTPVRGFGNGIETRVCIWVLPTVDDVPVENRYAGRVGRGIDFCLAERIGWVVGLGEEERRRDGAASRDDGLVAGEQGSR